MPRRTIPGAARMPTAENRPTETPCLFCPEPARITEWHYTDDTCLVIDKPSGDPMVVLRRHAVEPTDEELQHMHDVVRDVFGEHEFTVLMNHVTEHFHAHIDV